MNPMGDHSPQGLARPKWLGRDGTPLLVIPRWVWDGHTLRRDTAVAMEAGRWSRAGPAEDLRRDFQGEHLELPAALVMPGLVNWHCHLELSHVTPPPPPACGGDGFVAWLGEVMSRGPKSAVEAAEAALAGIEACERFGVACVHDITRHPHAVRRALAGRSVDVVSYAEITGMARRRRRADAMLDAATDLGGLIGAPNLTFGLSPHAPYSTEFAVYARCAELCRERGWPLTTHLGEVPDERAFVEQQTGAFRTLWERLGDWSDDVPTSKLTDLLWTCGPGVLLAHGNDLTTTETALLREQRGRIVHCPRTHAYFRRPEWDLSTRLRSGVSLRIGTDSLASCPDLNLLADLRHLAARHPEVPAATLWRMAMDDTPIGSRVLAWQVGSDGDPLEELLRQKSPTDAADDSTM